MNERTAKKQGKNVVRKVMKYWRKFDTVDKQRFEKGVDIIIKQVARYTGESVEAVSQYTDEILFEFPEDYKKMPDAIKGHESIILVLYVKYLRKMGVLRGDSPLAEN